MTKHYKTLALEGSVFDLFDDCEFIYRKAHPELKHVYLSKSKIEFEIRKFYLKGTEKEVLNWASLNRGYKELIKQGKAYLYLIFVYGYLLVYHYYYYISF